MRSVINKDYNYVIYKKNFLLLNSHKKILRYHSNDGNKFCKSGALRFVFLDLYQEGFLPNHYYGFSVTSGRKAKVKLFRPSDRSFFNFSLNFPGLLYLKVFSKT